MSKQLEDALDAIQRLRALSHEIGKLSTDLSVALSEAGTQMTKIYDAKPSAAVREYLEKVTDGILRAQRNRNQMETGDLAIRIDHACQEAWRDLF
jgi:hypothetical protein